MKEKHYVKIEGKDDKFQIRHLVYPKTEGFLQNYFNNHYLSARARDNVFDNDSYKLMKSLKNCMPLSNNNNIFDYNNNNNNSDSADDDVLLEFVDVEDKYNMNIEIDTNLGHAVPIPARPSSVPPPRTSTLQQSAASFTAPVTVLVTAPVTAPVTACGKTVKKIEICIS